MRFPFYTTILMMTLSCASLAHTEELNDEDDIIFYPTYGSLQNGLWKFRVYGVVFENEQDSASREFLINRLESDELTDPKEKANFDRRGKLFMIDHQSDKSITIKIVGTKKQGPI